MSVGHALARGMGTGERLEVAWVGEVDGGQHGVYGPSECGAAAPDRRRQRDRVGVVGRVDRLGLLVVERCDRGGGVDTRLVGPSEKRLAFAEPIRPFRR